MDAIVNGNSKTYYKPRSEFSEAHYDLPGQCGMFDIDIMKGEWLKLDTISGKEETTFVEYRCLKNGDNKFNLDRFKPIAIFELKHHGTNRVKDLLDLPEGKSTWAAFMMSKKLDCRFFIVVATNGKNPFYFFEYDKLGNRKKHLTLDYSENNREDKINKFWKKLKLL